MSILMSTGFAELDRCIGGGFQRHTSTLVVSPPDFGHVEYAHYLVMQAENSEIVSSVVTAHPDVLPDVGPAYTDYLIPVTLETPGAVVLSRLQQVTPKPSLIVVVDVMDELVLELLSTKDFATLIIFATSNAGTYDQRRPLHWAYSRCEVVLVGMTVGSDTSRGKFWAIDKNKFGEAGIGTNVNERHKGGWES